MISVTIKGFSHGLWAHQLGHYSNPPSMKPLGVPNYKVMHRTRKYTTGALNFFESSFSIFIASPLFLAPSTSSDDLSPLTYSKMVLSWSVVGGVSITFNSKGGCCFLSVEPPLARADASFKTSRIRTDEGNDGRWKRVMTSSVLC